MASLDLDNSYKQAENRLSALKTFTEVKGSINEASKITETQLTPNFNTTKFEEQKAEIEQKIKKKVQSSFERLLGLILSQKGSGQDTFKFILLKLLRAVQILKNKLSAIITEAALKTLGCDVNQIFESGKIVWIKISSFDLFDILKEDPLSKTGKLLYEKQPYSSSDEKKSVNRALYQFILNNNSQNYIGFSNNTLFSIKYEQINTNPGDPMLGDASGWYKVTLSSQGKVVQFLNDYYRTINYFDLSTLISNLMEAIFGIVSIKLKSGSVKIDDTTKFGLIVQRILGLCFDEEQEISVSGQAKTSELDDTSDSFFEMVGSDLSVIEQRSDQIKRGVVELETCENIELPVDADGIIDIIERIEFNNDDDFVNGLESVKNLLSNNPKWSLELPYPQISVSFDFNIVKKIPIAVVSTIINPKVLLPFFIMLKSLDFQFDENIKGLSGFAKQFKKFFITIASKIGAEFVRILFEEIKKDIQKLIILVIRLIIKDEGGQIGRMIEKILSLAQFVINIVKDYRSCKSIIDAILQLFNLIPQLGSIPMPILMLSGLLPGYSANRAFIGSIEELQKLGLPTGALPDGSPNLALQSIFAQMKSQDEEQKLNGKIEAVVTLPFPQGPVKVTGKAR